jgi:hypothetical protein
MATTAVHPDPAYMRFLEALHDYSSAPTPTKPGPLPGREQGTRAATGIEIESAKTGPRSISSRCVISGVLPEPDREFDAGGR